MQVTKAGRLDSISGWVIPEHMKNSTCGLYSLVLGADGCVQGNI